MTPLTANVWSAGEEPDGTGLAGEGLDDEPAHAGKMVLTLTKHAAASVGTESRLVKTSGQLRKENARFNT